MRQREEDTIISFTSEEHKTMNRTHRKRKMATNVEKKTVKKI